MKPSLVSTESSLLRIALRVCTDLRRRGQAALIPVFLGLLTLGGILALLNLVSPLAPFVYSLF